MSPAHTEYPLQLLQHLRTIVQAVGETENIEDDSHQAFVDRYDELLGDLGAGMDVSHQGQELISQIFLRYPQIAHLVPRDLLWFFGGDCLHFMPDEEIALFQKLEELRFEAEKNGTHFDWNTARQQLLEAHAKPLH